MIVYWTGCLASVLTAVLGIKIFDRNVRNKLVIFFSALPLTLIAMLRYDVGEDYLFTYLPYFEAISGSVSLQKNQMEPLYHFINVMVSTIGGESVWVFAISAVIFFSMVFLQIFYDSPDPALSIFLLVGMNYYFVFFNAMRQMIGCGILLFSVRYIYRKKLLNFLFCIAIATGFHISCILFVAMYWIGKIKIRPAVAWILTIVVVMLESLLTEIMRELIELTPYSIYFFSIFDTGETAYVTLAINAVVLVFSSFFYRNNFKYQIYYNLQIAALWVTLFSGKIVLILRLLWMFGLPAIILLPMAVHKLKNKRDQYLVKSIIVLAYFLYTMYTVGVQNSNHVLPYQTVFGRWL